jgi:cysteine desulfurase
MLEKTKDFENPTKVYLDHNASTPVASEVLQSLAQIAAVSGGNPSSIHRAGREPKALLREARQSIASALGGISPLEIIFTSGGTESNNTVIKGIFDSFSRAQNPRNEYITSKVEHPSVLRAFEWIEKRGAQVHYLSVNRQGEIDLVTYEKILSEKTALVSVMLANNETGTLFPIQKMAKKAHEHGALFHSDCVQTLGKISLSMHKLELDYASFSAHKVYALKGAGVLYARKGVPYEPLIQGGGQERHRRGGTENVLGIWALGLMCKQVFQVAEMYPHWQSLRDHFEARVLAEIPHVRLTGIESPRLPNTSGMVIDDVDGEILLMSLDLLGFAVSTGAACSSGSSEPSPALLAMGLTRVEAQSSLRVSLGWKTTKSEIDDFVEALRLTVQRLRSLQKVEDRSIKARMANV